MDKKIDEILTFINLHLPPTTPAPSISTPNPISITTGRYHSCVIDDLSDLWCWGRNHVGQLGMGDTVDRSSPTRVVLQNNKILEVAVGAYHSCILDLFSKLKCWGKNDYGQLGSGDTVNSLSPNQVALENNVTQVFSGHHNTCVIDFLSNLLCWGRNEFANLGLGHNATLISTPTKVTLVSNAAQVSFGDRHMCVVDVLSKLWCSGSNEEGQLGLNDTIVRNTPTEVSLEATRQVAQVHAGTSHTCALDDVSHLWCWGRNQHGQLGTGDNSSRLTPTQVISLASAVSQLSVGFYHTCIIDVTSSLYCWGYNHYGQVGVGYHTPTGGISIPTQINLANGVAQQISLGGFYSCVLDDNETIHCWGRNDDGQLGLSNTLGGYNSPTVV